MYVLSSLTNNWTVQYDNGYQFCRELNYRKLQYHKSPISIQPTNFQGPLSFLTKYIRIM